MRGQKRRRQRAEAVQEFHRIGRFRRIVSRGQRKLRNRNVLRRIRLEVVHLVGKFLPVQHQQVPVADAGVEGHVVVAEGLLQVGHQLRRNLVVDVPRRIVAQHPVRRRVDQVAAERHVVLPERNPLAHRLDRAAPRIVPLRIKPEHRHIRHVRRGRQPLRKRQERPVDAARGDRVHGRRVDRFERRLPAELFKRFVRHAVGEKNNCFAIHFRSSER